LLTNDAVRFLSNEQQQPQQPPSPVAKLGGGGGAKGKVRTRGEQHLVRRLKKDKKKTTKNKVGTIDCPECGPPSNTIFTAAYNAELETLRALGILTSIDSIDTVTELQVVACIDAYSNFESNVIVEFGGKP
jgi:hypothetical protein